MQVQPYLFFEGRCREALDFYQKTLGAEVLFVSKFGDSPEPHPAPVPADAIMHVTFKIGSSTIMASDGHCSGKANFGGFALSVAPDDDEQAKTVFANLSADGQVRMPLQKTFFASSFGMCTDKFGVLWMVHVEAKQ